MYVCRYVVRFADIAFDIDMSGGWIGLDRPGYKDIHSNMYDVRSIRARAWKKEKKGSLKIPLSKPRVAHMESGRWYSSSIQMKTVNHVGGSSKNLSW